MTSIVGRFLEHSRIYSFERHSEPESIYIGSADLMPRNLYNRVELLTPIFDDKVRAELVDVLDRSLADNTNSWELGEDGTWTRRRPDGDPRIVQQELIERHVERAASGAAVETAGRHRTPERADASVGDGDRHDGHGYWLAEAGPADAGAGARGRAHAQTCSSSAAATPAFGPLGT